MSARHINNKDNNRRTNDDTEMTSLGLSPRGSMKLSYYRQASGREGHASSGPVSPLRGVSGAFVSVKSHVLFSFFSGTE